MKNCNLKYIGIICMAFIHNMNAQDLCGSYSGLPVDSLKSKAGGMVSNCLKANDSCILNVIGYCRDSYVLTNKRSYLEIIDSCWKHSDGYLSDFLTEVSTDLFNEKLEGWLKYVYDNRNDTVNRGYATIKNLFVEGMIEYGKQGAEEKVNSVQSSPKYTAQHKKYLKALFEKTNFTE